MTLYSTPESIRSQTVSALAIAETVLAISLAAALFWWGGNSNHFLLGGILAPFLLLQSDSSNRQAAKWVIAASPFIGKILAYCRLVVSSHSLFELLYLIPSFRRFSTKFNSKDDILEYLVRIGRKAKERMKQFSPAKKIIVKLYFLIIIPFAIAVLTIIFLFYGIEFLVRRIG
jgi:hypothetical protein